MPDEVQISEDGKYISILSSGKISVSELKRTFEKILDIHNEHGINKVLVDSREREMMPTKMQTFEGSTLLAQILRSKVRIAILVKGNISRHQFFEDVAVNRGAKISYFNDIESAKQWLSL